MAREETFPIEAWEFDRSCSLDDVRRVAAERLASPSFRGRVLARRGDALTVALEGGAPTGAPDSLYWVAHEGAFHFARLEARGAGGPLLTLRAVR